MPIRKAVLIVDDDKAVRELLHDFLVKEGFDASCADSGIAALALIEKKHFDIVITDCSMPGMSGIELIRELRSRPACFFIIGISGVCKGGEFLKAGAEAFLSKPFRLHELLSLFRAEA